MNAILKLPGKPPCDFDLSDWNLLDNVRNVIGGCIEPVPLNGGVKCLCDKSGVSKLLPRNCGLVGPLVFVATFHDDYGEQWVGLTEEQKQSVGSWIAANEYA